MTSLAQTSETANRPAVPVSNGTLAMWLFLTTEAMFFAALVGAWLVVRSTAGESWPEQRFVHVNMLVGIVNTIVLLVSGVAAWRAAQMAERGLAGSARKWILVTMLLGFVFLGVKGYEYYEKHKLGLVSVGETALMHDRSDALYVSAVGATIKDRLLNDTTLDGTESESLELVQSGLVAWTSSRAGRSSDATYQQELYDSLAAMIFPVGDIAKDKVFLEAESVSLDSDAEALKVKRTNLENRLAELQKQLAEPAPVGAGSTDTEAAKKEATAITLELSLINVEITQIESRLRALNRFVSDIDSGINATEHLRLPVVVPGGRMWSSTWLLLTGMHALHMLAGLVAWLFVLPVRNQPLFTASVGNCARYWHFVDAVWIVIFLIVYCY